VDSTTNGVSNEITLRRAGVALFSPGYTGQQRLQIWNGTLAYDPGDPEQECFVSRKFLNGQDREFFIGHGSFQDLHWARAAERILNAPLVNMRYARLVTLDGEVFRLTADHNVPALSAYVGQSMELDDLYAVAGLRYMA